MSNFTGPCRIEVSGRNPSGSDVDGEGEGIALSLDHLGEMILGQVTKVSEDTDGGHTRGAGYIKIQLTELVTITCNIQVEKKGRVYEVIPDRSPEELRADAMGALARFEAPAHCAGCGSAAVTAEFPLCAECQARAGRRHLNAIKKAYNVGLGVGTQAYRNAVLFAALAAKEAIDRGPK